MVGRPRKTSNAGLRSYATASATTPCSPMVMVVTPVSPSRGASRKNESWPQLRGRSADPWRKKPRSQAVYPPTLANLVRTLSKYSEMDQRENCPTCGSSKQYPGAIAEESLWPYTGNAEKTFMGCARIAGDCRGIEHIVSWHVGALTITRSNLICGGAPP